MGRQQWVNDPVALIEIEIGGSLVRVGRGADGDTVAAVIAALKRTK